MPRSGSWALMALLALGCDASPQAGAAGNDAGEQARDGSAGALDGSIDAAAGPPRDASNSDGAPGFADAAPDGAIAEAPRDSAHRSGTRLKRRVYTAAGGARAFKAIWDTSLAGECSFATAEDGRERCLPTPFEAVVFTDALCTDPVYLLPDDGCSFAHAYSSETSGECGNFTTTYRAYAVQSSPATLTGDFFRKTRNGCVSGGSSAGLAFRTVSPVDASAFVAAERISAPRAEGLSAEFHRGEDGSFWLRGLHDTERGQPCNLAGGRCVPTRGISVTAAGKLFADSSCTQPVAVTPDGQCPPGIALSTVVTGPECATTSTVTYLEIGDAIADADVFRDVAGSCEAAGSVPGPVFRTTGPVQASSFPGAGERLEGDGAQKVVVPIDSEGAVIGAPVGFVQGDPAAECSIVWFENGGYRCLPAGTLFESASPVETHYGDDTCGGPTLIPGWQCDPQPPFAVRTAPSTRCAPTTIEVIEPAASSYGGSSIWFSNGGATCAEAVLNGDFAPFFVRGAAGSAQDLPALQLELD